MLEQKGEMVEGLYNITDRYRYIVVVFFCHERFVGTLVELVCTTLFVVHQVDWRRLKKTRPVSRQMWLGTSPCSPTVTAKNMPTRTVYHKIS